MPIPFWAFILLVLSLIMFFIVSIIAAYHIGRIDQISKHFDEQYERYDEHIRQKRSGGGFL